MYPGYTKSNYITISHHIIKNNHTRFTHAMQQSTARSHKCRGSSCFSKQDHIKQPPSTYKQEWVKDFSSFVHDIEPDIPVAALNAIPDTAPLTGDGEAWYTYISNQLPAKQDIKNENNDDIKDNIKCDEGTAVKDECDIKEEDNDDDDNNDNDIITKQDWDKLQATPLFPGSQSSVLEALLLTHQYLLNSNTNKHHSGLLIKLLNYLLPQGHAFPPSFNKFAKVWSAVKKFKSNILQAFHNPNTQQTEYNICTSCDRLVEDLKSPICPHCRAPQSTQRERSFFIQRDIAHQLQQKISRK
jgi:hypothetical protein